MPADKLATIASEFYWLALLATRLPNNLMVSPGSKTSLEFTKKLAECATCLSEGADKPNQIAKVREGLDRLTSEFGLWQSKEVDRLTDELLTSFEKVVASIRDTLSESSHISEDMQEVQGNLRRAQSAGSIEEMRSALVQQTEKLQGVVQKQGAVQQMLRAEYEASVKTLETQLSAAEENGRTDHLTRIANRGAFEQQLDLAFKNLGQKSDTYSLAITDLNKFKAINDTLGHAAGDACLKVYAQELKSIFSSIAFVARLGGDEFAVLYPGTAGQLEDEMRKLQVALVKKPVRTNPKDPQETVTLACSFGCAQMRPGDTPESIYERADEAMYQMKKSNGASRAA